MKDNVYVQALFWTVLYCAVATLFMALVSGCNPDQGLTVIPDPPPAPIEGPRVVELGPVPPVATLEDAVDLYEQEENATDIDVYVLIDQSCSMTTADDRAVGDALTYLVGDLEASMSPSGTWTVTFGTTSTTQTGILPTFYRPPATDLPMILMDIRAAAIGLTGWSGEAGFAASYDLLNTGMVPDTTDNKLYIIVSDEDDQSRPPDASIHTSEGDGDWYGNGTVFWSYHWEVTEFTDWAMSEPSTDLLFITPDNDRYGRRYKSAAAIHGRHINLDSDWSGALSGMTWVTILNDTYTLSHDPYPGSLRVYEDGVQIWAWTINGRTLRLTNPPGIGVEVKAKYKYWSL